MTLAICTLACGRSDLTRHTLETFMRHNPNAKGMMRLAAIDHHSFDEDTANVRHFAEFGWNPIALAMQREGVMWGMRELVTNAVARGATKMLWLENDWECIRSLRDTPDTSDVVDCVRLYGVEKQQDGKRPAGTLNMVTGLVIPWQDVQFKRFTWESAKAHFGGAPSIVDLACVAPFIDRGTMKDMARAMGELRTVRPKSNYFWHTGLESTPGFRH